MGSRCGDASCPALPLRFAANLKIPVPADPLLRVRLEASPAEAVGFLVANAAAGIDRKTVDRTVQNHHPEMGRDSHDAVSGAINGEFQIDRHYGERGLRRCRFSPRGAGVDCNRQLASHGRAVEAVDRRKPCCRIANDVAEGCAVRRIGCPLEDAVPAISRHAAVEVPQALRVVVGEVAETPRADLLPGIGGGEGRAIRWPSRVLPATRCERQGAQQGACTHKNLCWHVGVLAKLRQGPAPASHPSPAQARPLPDSAPPAIGSDTRPPASAGCAFVVGFAWKVTLRSGTQIVRRIWRYPRLGRLNRPPRPWTWLYRGFLTL